MHTSKDDYLINTLRFVSAKETTQIYGVVLPESLTNLEMKETKAYKTYLGFATGATPPKKAQKFKKSASPQLSSVLVSPEEPTRKSRSKGDLQEVSKAPARGCLGFIRDTPEMPLSKKKEKVYVARGKGIELLSNVALTKEAHDVSLCSAMIVLSRRGISFLVLGGTDTPYLLDGYGVLSSWVSRMLLYIKVKERRKLLMNSVLNGPFKYGTVTVPGTATAPATVKDRTYDELIDAEKIHEGCDINTTNIVLQVLPQD
ncbi:hypothetical protein Tco_0734230 [Tanacetum coccineum]